MANRKENKYEEETPTGIQKKKKNTHTQPHARKNMKIIKKKSQGTRTAVAHRQTCVTK